MQKKTTRAFRTISEAGDELDLQPHVLRFWESKFPQIKPIKRGGGRRFYRPEDIEFLRGIKILLHDEKHPIKDVQKLIRVKGAQRVIELGQSVEKASRDKDVAETVLIPKRIQDAPLPDTATDDPIARTAATKTPESAPTKIISFAAPQPDAHDKGLDEAVTESSFDRGALIAALEQLEELRARWKTFKAD